MRAFHAAVILATFIVAVPLLAVDGVLEINQTCAESALGCFSGDAPGYPVEISSPGSYRLTSNLSPTVGPVDVVEISSDDVSLDLNGFALLGGTICTETGALPNVVTCTPGGIASNGVALALPSTNERIEIRNGAIQGMQSRGINAANGAATVVRDVRLMHNGAGGLLAFSARVVEVVASLNGGAGISLGPSSAVFRCEATSNNGAGIQGDEALAVTDCRSSHNVGDGVFAMASIITGSGSVIDRNRLIGNGGSGIAVAQNSVVTRNVVHNSQADGILAEAGSSIDGNTVTDSQGDGISCSEGCTVTRNSAFNNLAGNGIFAGDGSTVLGNTVRNNAGDGLSLGLDAGYDQNVMSGNTNDVSGSGTSLGQNLCSGSPC